MAEILNIIKEYFHEHTTRFIIADFIEFTVGVVMILFIISICANVIILSTDTRDKRSSNYTRLFYQSMFDYDNSWWELLIMVVSICYGMLGLGMVELIDPNHRKSK